jgi:hypothetical protein
VLWLESGICFLSHLLSFLLLFLSLLASFLLFSLFALAFLFFSLELGSLLPC